MLRLRFRSFFGDDLEDTWDAVRSVPGAFGNIVVGVVRQIRLFDLMALSVVVAGLAWLLIGHLAFERGGATHYVLSALPLALWFAAGIFAGFVFHIGAIGKRALRYWESYMLILLFGVFGVLSLRLALDPRDRRVFRATAEAIDVAVEGGPRTL